VYERKALAPHQITWPTVCGSVLTNVPIIIWVKWVNAIRSAVTMMMKIRTAETARHFAVNA